MKTNRDVIVPALKAINKEHVIDLMPPKNNLDEKANREEPHDVMYQLFDWGESPKADFRFWVDLKNELHDFWNKSKMRTKPGEPSGDFVDDLDLPL